MEEEQHNIMQLCPSLLGLKRVGEITPIVKKKIDMPVLNKRGMPPRVRKKNPLFFSNEIYNDHRVLKIGDHINKLKKTPGKHKSNYVDTFLIDNQDIKKLKVQENQLLTEQQQEYELRKTAAHAAGIRLRNVLKLPKAFNWVCSEFYYSIVDKPVFQDSDNDFVICMKESFPEIKKYFLTRTEWGFIRRMLGKPRRCSSIFYGEEVVELNRRRSVLRSLQRNQLDVLRTTKDIPNIFPQTPAVGTRVTARLYNLQNGVFSGHITVVDTSRNGYLIKFDNSALGLRFIADYDILIKEAHLKTTTKGDIIKTIFKLNEKGTYKFARKLMREFKARFHIKDVDVFKKPFPVDKATKKKKLKKLSPVSASSLRTHTTNTSCVSSVPSKTCFSSHLPSLSSKNQPVMSEKVKIPVQDIPPSPCNSTTQSTSPDLQEREDMLGNHPIDMLQTIVRLRTLLNYKNSNIQELRNMNTEIERTLLYEKEISEDFQTKYAGNIITLEEINRDLLETINDLNNHLKALVPIEIMSSILTPIYLQDHTLNVATELVNKNNNILSNDSSKPAVKNKSVLNSIRDLTALILQVKSLAEYDHNDYEVDVLRKSMLQIKKKLNPNSCKIFENSVEIHMRQIQAGLIGSPGFSSFINPTNSNDEDADKHHENLNGDM